MKGLKCRYTEEMCPYIPVALSIQCDECMVKKAYKRGFYEERPHGEWITKGAVGNGTWCSECDANIMLFPNKYSFCPYCGSDNRKREGVRNETYRGGV